MASEVSVSSKEIETSFSGLDVKETEKLPSVPPSVISIESTVILIEASPLNMAVISGPLLQERNKLGNNKKKKIKTVFFKCIDPFKVILEYFM